MFPATEHYWASVWIHNGATSKEIKVEPKQLPSLYISAWGWIHFEQTTYFFFVHQVLGVQSITTRSLHCWSLVAQRVFVLLVDIHKLYMCILIQGLKNDLLMGW